MYSFQTEALYNGPVEFNAHVLRTLGIKWAFDSEGNLLSGPVPSVFRPDGRGQEWLDTYREQLAELDTLTPDQIAAKARSDWEVRNKEHRDDVLGMNERWYRYDQMLRQLHDWAVPANLQEHKAKLIKDLEEAIGREIYPIQPPYPLQGNEEWFAEQKKMLEDTIASRQRRLNEEDAEARARTTWLQSLLTSLGIEFSEESVPSR